MNVVPRRLKNMACERSAGIRPAFQELSLFRLRNNEIRIERRPPLLIARVDSQSLFLKLCRSGQILEGGRFSFEGLDGSRNRQAGRDGFQLLPAVTTAGVNRRQV